MRMSHATSYATGPGRAGGTAQDVEDSLYSSICPVHARRELHCPYPSHLLDCTKRRNRCTTTGDQARSLHNLSPWSCSGSKLTPDAPHHQISIKFSFFPERLQGVGHSRPVERLNGSRIAPADAGSLKTRDSIAWGPPLTDEHHPLSLRQSTWSDHETLDTIITALDLSRASG